MKLSTLLLSSVLLLSACAPSEAAVKRQLADANHCDAASDCTDIGSKCPFGCSIYVHRDEADRMRAIVEAFPSRCEYGCMQVFGVECQQQKCAAITVPPASSSSSSSDPEGNVGAACTSSTECSTPMSYLLRSSCPFGAACVDDACAVVCPMPSKEERLGWTKPMSCTADADCDCSRYIANDMESCRCIDGACLAVVEQ